MSMGCVLRVGGKTFPVDDFLAGTALKPCKVWHVGELRLPKTKPPYTDSGFNLVTSDANDLPLLVTDTIAFLTTHRQEMLHLVKTPGLEYLILDFGIARHDVLAQYDRFPVELIRLAAEFGMSIELSHYG